jgi:hypothetical protein
MAVDWPGHFRGARGGPPDYQCQRRRSRDHELLVFHADLLIRMVI